MFGNKYQGDELAKEFYKLVTLKKVASEEGSEEKENLAADLQNYVEDEVVDAAQFLDIMQAAPDVAADIESSVSDLDSWAADGSQVGTEDDCGDTPMYSDDSSFLLDQRASVVLNGLGKIAGSLKQRGETFAADIVEATALSIRKDMVKEASRKLETITLLSKIASDISGSGDQFTADIVSATINKIKTAQMDDYEPQDWSGEDQDAKDRRVLELMLERDDISDEEKAAISRQLFEDDKASHVELWGEDDWEDTQRGNYGAEEWDIIKQKLEEDPKFSPDFSDY